MAREGVEARRVRENTLRLQEEREEQEIRARKKVLHHQSHRPAVVNNWHYIITPPGDIGATVATFTPEGASFSRKQQT